MAGKRQAVPGPEVELPIVPFLDVTFQLLFFFISIFNPSGLEVQMDMSLPAAGEARAESLDKVNPDKMSDVEIEIKSEVTVIVQNDNERVGHIGHLMVVVDKEIPISRDRTMSDSEKLNELEKYLKKAQKDLTNKTDIKIQADSQLKLLFVVGVIDKCKRAGFQNIAFAPPPDLGSTP